MMTPEGIASYQDVCKLMGEVFFFFKQILHFLWW